ncbi:hypothetical protein DY000_02001269 [Brassica cretica]|uniref:MATH domain-containing protein n=1 Tax=Brassica cretica TaxID=69181 RepID=A0ABQ7CC35_BRACR|nr:hypothetical protein DY000_02001269 [Brassica cretica]
MAGRCRKCFNTSSLSSPLHNPATVLGCLRFSAISSVATSICCYARPLGSFNDSSTLFGHQNTPWGTEFIMKLSPTPDKD